MASQDPQPLGTDRTSQLRQIAVEWKEAWRTGVAALLAGSLCYSLYPALSSLFVEPLQAQFGWSRGEIAFVHSFGLVTAFAAPVLGRLTDRFGVRPVLSLGIVMTAVGYLLLAAMQGSLTYYYAAYFVFSVSGLATTGLTVTRILTGAFHATRGTALAIGRSGLAIAGALMPLLLFPVLVRFGTSGGFLMLAAFIVFIVFPAVRMWVPAQPSRFSSTRASHDEDSPEPWRALLWRPKVLILIAASVFNYVPVVALLSQMKPIAIEKGLDPSAAVAAVSMVGIAAALGAFLSGVLVDRIWAPAVAFALNLAPAFGCLLLLQGDVSPVVFFTAIIFVGLGQGAEIDIVAFMIARYFGLRSYATIYSLSTLGIALGVAAGGTLIGAAHDRFGNYDIAIAATSASFALAAVMYLAMGKYPSQVPR